MILKRVRLFAETPDEVLIEAAEALEEIDVAAGTCLFRAGEPGNRMYIIVFGKVQVHLEDSVLNVLGEGDIFGEMSLLDSQPRTASVSTVEDSRLLQLSQETLYELMSDHSEVMRGIIRFLTSQLRSRLHESDRSLSS
jgi:CRP-like cAMP-binding protein